MPVFMVLPSGEVTDIRFTERSGNSYLDESAYKADVKASPVSPHPQGIRELYVTVALRFTPQGIRLAFLKGRKLKFDSVEAPYYCLLLETR